MPTLIEQLLLDDPSQVIERGNFFESGLVTIGVITDLVTDLVTDRSDEYINHKVVNKIFSRLIESSEHFKKILNTHLSKINNINIDFSCEEFEELRERKEELVIDSFCYKINFNVDFTLNYFENISKIYLKIYLKICPSFKYGGRFTPNVNVLDIGVTGYLCYESNERILHQEKLSFKPRTTASIQYLYLYSQFYSYVNITNIFKHDGNYDGIFSLFKKDVAEKLALLINVD